MTIAFVFPGQGSQSQGMLKDLAEKYSVVKEVFQEASTALNYDLWDVIQNQPELLSKTEYTQPALLASSYAIYKVIAEVYPDLKADYYAGHSLGEYSALTCAGVFTFTDAIKLVQLRGQEMQNAVPNGGAMYAILGLTNEEVIQACATTHQEFADLVVSAVNFNSPGQVVIAGNLEAVEAAAQICKDKGAKRALPLPVSIPSHCALMLPAAKNIEKYLENVKINNANISVLHNYDLSISETAEQIKDALVAQLHQPVLWEQSVNKLNDLGITKLIEIGPNKVLTGLAPRINTNIKSMAVNDIASLEKLEAFING